MRVYFNFAFLCELRCKVKLFFGNRTTAAALSCFVSRNPQLEKGKVCHNKVAQRICEVSRRRFDVCKVGRGRDADRGSCGVFARSSRVSVNYKIALPD